MEVRFLKILLVLFVALLCLMYATQNVVNLQAAYSFVAAVVTMDGHLAYPASFGPSFNSPALIWSVLMVIIALEYLAGLLAAKGAWDLWRARRAPASDFNESKTYALLGAGAALLVWFGLFSTIGGAYFQMWQTDLGNASLQGAFQLSMMIGVVLLLVNMQDR